ncbi:MAG: PadR family transcriptional regulator [Acidimicrobiia bacterium]|nr:PadR family transcriptional regulator [Acidimicrobiia bacterium]
MSYAMAPPWVTKRRMAYMTRKGRRGWGHQSHWGGYPMGKGQFFSGRPRVSRGDVRIAILQLLAEEPMHGYQIIQELTDRTDGVWQPSPGSIYPTLQQLEDEGLVRSEQRDGKNVYELTDDGRSAVDADTTTPPWERMGSNVEGELLSLRDAAFQVGAAVMQVARTGTEAQVEEAKAILDEARRKLYRILAEDESSS